LEVMREAVRAVRQDMVYTPALFFVKSVAHAFGEFLELVFGLGIVGINHEDLYKGHNEEVCGRHTSMCLSKTWYLLNC
jgi:hypothetical protein